MIMKCKHQWQQISEPETGRVNNNSTNADVYVLKCKKCGEVRKKVVKKFGGDQRPK